MAGQLMLVNPRKRKTKTRTFRRNPDPPKTRRKAKPKLKTRVKRGARKARKSFMGFATKARRRTSKFVSAARKGGRRTKTYRAKRQNLSKMISNPASFVRATVVPSAVGAVGALALDVAYAYLPIPANIKNGALAPVVKIGAVSLVGAVAAHFAPQKTLKPIHTAVQAAIIITAYSWLKSRVQAMAPQIRLGSLEDDGMGYVQSGIYMQPVDNGVGEYVSGPSMGQYMSGAGALSYTYTDSDYADQVS